MATLNRASFDMERNSSAITITKADGTIVRTTYEEIQKARKAKANADRKKKRQKKSVSYTQWNAEYAVKMVKELKVLKSLCAYYDHGYRQWGTICRDEIINNALIRDAFVSFRRIALDIEKQIAMIENERKNSKDIYQLIEKLSYLIDDMGKAMSKLTSAISESRVCEFFSKHEMICGEGRRLGLSILMQRSLLALINMQNTFKELNTISVNGAEIEEYNPYGSFGRF